MFNARFLAGKKDAVKIQWVEEKAGRLRYEAFPLRKNSPDYICLLPRCWLECAQLLASERFSFSIHRSSIFADSSGFSIDWF